MPPLAQYPLVGTRHPENAMLVSVNSILSVLFFRPYDIANKASFVNAFLEHTKAFDGDPMILPIGNAPPPVPRIVLKNREGSFVCEVALDRLNFSYVDVANRKRSLESLYPEYRKILDLVTQAAVAGVPSPVIRMGFVTRHLIETGEGANLWFRDTYLNTQRLPAAWETHLNFLERFEMESFPVNRWIKMRTLRDQQNPEVDPAVLAEIDINTFAENAGPYDHSAILAFYLEGFARAEEDLRTYVLRHVQGGDA
jgi:hypothetical protein